MKRLIVMRHAKSSWGEPGLTDHQRPLKGRGRREAPQVARALRGCGWIPELVFSSDSERTRQTWSLMADEFPGATAVFLSSFYGGGTEEVLAELAGVSRDRTIVMVLGHNPGCDEVVEDLGGSTVGLSTACAALLEADGDDWPTIAAPSMWRLVDVIRPKDLVD